jgi:hypothetical protein
MTKPKKDKHRMHPLHAHEFSPMERGTCTKTRRQKRRQGDKWDRKAKHKGKDW